MQCEQKRGGLSSEMQTVSPKYSTVAGQFFQGSRTERRYRVVWHKNFKLSNSKHT